MSKKPATTKAKTQPSIKAIKGFDKNLQCRGRDGLLPDVRYVAKSGKLVAAKEAE